MIKRWFDFTAALLGLICLTPILALVTLAIRLDSPGPIFHKSTRVGKGGLLFGMYKFRTMRNDNGPRVTARGDPRITRIGRILRETKLNELPQLFNVLKGEMSLVGPRPEDPEFVAHYSPEERKVLSVRPGITSLAAIAYFDEERMLNYGTAAETYLSKIMPDKLQLDLLYIRHRSLLSDMDVLLRTFLSLIPMLRRAAPDIEEILFGPVQRMIRKHIPWFILDLVTAYSAVAVAGLIWRAADPLDLGWTSAMLAAFVLAFAFSLVNWVMGVQRTAWCYAGAGEVLDIVLSSAISTTLLLIGNVLLPLFPAGMLVLGGFFALAGFVTARYRSRLLSGALQRLMQVTTSLNAARVNAIVIGAGEAGQMMVRLLKNSRQSQLFHVIGIVDDDLGKRGMRIHGVDVFGVPRNIPRLVKEYNVALLIFAIHDIDQAEREAILILCENTDASVVVMPDMLSALNRWASVCGEEPGVHGQSVVESSPTNRNGWVPRMIPPIKIGNGNGIFVESDTVIAWMEGLAHLAAEGRLNDVEQRLREIQASLGEDSSSKKAASSLSRRSILSAGDEPAGEGREELIQKGD
ncbi:MAG: sugar transferase [Chloroflexi bacterium]|nr:sugar transferase [Chloroflexota bacterium]